MYIVYLGRYSMLPKDRRNRVTLAARERQLIHKEMENQAMQLATGDVQQNIPLKTIGPSTLIVISHIIHPFNERIDNSSHSFDDPILQHATAGPLSYFANFKFCLGVESLLVLTRGKGEGVVEPLISDHVNSIGYVSLGYL